MFDWFDVDLLMGLRFGVLICWLLVGLLLVLACGGFLLCCLLLITVRATLFACVCGLILGCCYWLVVFGFDYAVCCVLYIGLYGVF